jgi:HNH endonuclease
MKAEPSYCPYCNATDAVDLTDEHVIPESIGGDSRTLIRVCKPCNNSVGRDVDTMLSSNGWMRINGLFARGIAKRQDRLESTTTLKDGRKLEGYFFVIQTDKGTLPAFEPKKYQSDGTIWLSEDVVKNHESLPVEINIFRRDMVEYWGLDCPPERLGGMEPAMVKVLMGIIYMDQGQSVVSSSSFDVLRSSLGGTLHPNIAYTWLEKPMTWGDSTVKNHEHAVYFKCVDQKLFLAGVALFGTGITFQIQNFNCFLPKRCVRWIGRPGPQQY